MKWTKVGSVPVDSGQLMLVDPCYLHDWKHGDFDGNRDENAPPLNHDEEACRATLSDENAGPCFAIGAPGGANHLAVATSTGWGDGEYPVERVRETR